MAKAVESELKFEFPREALRAVKVALDEMTGDTERRRLTARYFDTANNDLWRRGVTLRLRSNGDASMQTIKRETTSTLDRDEYESAIDSDTPDLAALKQTGLSRLFRKPKIRDRLRPNIEVEVTREVSAVASHGAEVETSLDIGEVRANGALSPISELELELKAGEKTGLYALARHLCANAPITLSVVSKAERGHLLAQGALGRAYKGRQPKITGRMNCADALELVCHACLHDFILNMQAIKGSDRVEAVHQGRVALRRLRAALQLFKGFACDEDHDRLDEELRWISHVFGEARDLDVFQESAFEPAAKAGDIPGARELAEHTDARRNRAADVAKAAIESKRLRALLIDLVAWIESGSWRQRDNASSRQPIKDYARKGLKKRLRKFVKQADNFPEFDAARQHKIRIRAKKLRYMAAFFKGSPKLVAKPNRLKRLLERLELIQNCLGELHDEQAKTDFLIEEIESLPKGADPKIGYAAGRLAQPANDGGKKLARAFRAFQKLKSASRRSGAMVG